ncbi:MAG: sugar phosphate isomerase/epimerase family protein [Bacillota bacterium]
MERFAGRLRVLHLRDDRGDEWAGLGDGKLDYPAVCDALKRTGFDGWLVIELEPGPNQDPSWDVAAALAESLARLRDWMS